MQSSSNLWNRKGQSAVCAPSSWPLPLNSAAPLSPPLALRGKRDDTVQPGIPLTLPSLCLARCQIVTEHHWVGGRVGGRGCFMLIDPAAELMFTCASPERRCSNVCKPSHPSTSTFTAATAAHTRPVCRRRQLTRKESVSSNCYINYVTLCVFHISPLGALDDTLIYCTESAGW